jgi:hypothetical protein
MTTTVYTNSSGEIIDLNGVKEKYFAHWPIKDIAKHYKCSWQQIGKIRLKELLSRRSYEYKYHIDHKFFDNGVCDELRAYVLGFLYADGCISKSHLSEITVSLQKQDIKILERIKDALKSNSPIETYTYKNRYYCRIRFYSKHLSNMLRELGCVPLKSYRLKWIDNLVGSLLMRHFIRGYFDGDGHFSFWYYKGKYLKSHFNITSTQHFCKGLSHFISSIFGCNFYMSKRNKKSNTNNRTIELSGNKQILRIMKWLYRDASIFLQRKKDKFDQFIVRYEKVLSPVS